MVPQPVIPPKLPADFDHYVVRFPTRYADYIPTEPPAKSASHPGFGVLPTPEGGMVVWALR